MQSNHKNELTTKIPRELTELLADRDHNYYLLLHHVTDEDYYKRAVSDFWNTPKEIAIFRCDKAEGGVVVFSRYGDEWDVDSWSSRHVYRVLLEKIGFSLPQPDLR